ncbi:iron uptake porin [Altericista sp. CCNU0014]|uniref:iron uptake porin n=1 Tax=Altericista sp. CCNU0014 TaxID=3082949 RepID=UPI003850F360
MFSAFQADRKSRLAVQVCVWTVLFGVMSAMMEGRSQTAQAEELTDIQPVSQISQQVDFGNPDATAPAFTSNAPLIQAVDDSDAGQVTSVSQLSDVQPTDWAFQALQSLVERYGCIAGYPDGTFRGNRAATRYELAAALNACLDQISDRFATKEDLAAVKALQEEFKAELATLKGRVDGLEARTKTLEAQQFSTTTKLSGNAFFNITGAVAGRGVTADGVDGILPFRAINQPDRGINGVPRTRIANDPNVTFSGLVWLNFNTSFTGKDLLRVQLASGTGDSPTNAFASAGLYNTWGTPFTDQTAGTTNGLGDFVLRELNYSFPVAKNFEMVVGPRINFYRYFDNNRFTFFLNGSTSFDSIGSPLLNASKRGAGAIAIWSPSKQLQIKLGYLSQSIEFLPSFLNSAENPNLGLFDGTNTLTGEVTYSPLKTLNLRFLYTRSNITTSFGGLIGGTAGLPLWGLADDGFGGNLRPATANTFGFNFDWLVTKGFGVFGRYTFGNVNLTPENPLIPKADVNNQSIQFGLAFPDLGKQGAQGTLSFVVPSDVISGRSKLISGGGDGGTQYDIEASYFYPINDNVALVPAFYAIINPNNYNSNPTVFVGNLRMQFNF